MRGFRRFAPLLAVAAAFARVASGQDPDPPAPGRSAGTSLAVPVEVGVIERGSTENRRTFTGNLEANAAVIVAPKIGGRIVGLEADHAVAQANVEKARILLDTAIRALRRVLAIRREHLHQIEDGWAPSSMPTAQWPDRDRVSG
ncbi:MAG: hypothetical protein KDK91_15140 [Gammaproteobacteria bacterium]|nr:hypothetical protein [Gammaproteobacteria bacterium]